MNLRPSSVRLRLTLWYSLILAGIVLVFSLFVFLFVKASLFRQLDRQLDLDYQTISENALEDAGETPEIENENSAKLYQIVKSGRPFYQTPAFQKSGISFLGPSPAGGSQKFLSPSGARFRIETGPISPDIHLTVAIEEGSVWSTLRTLSVILLLFLPIALGLAAFGGFVMAGRLLRPVAVIAAEADKISAKDLSARLPVENPRDEFGQLAGVVNRMLSRLEEAFESLRRFTADASHELRTPLTVIQSVGEVALQEDLDAAAYKDRIGSMLEDLSRLTRLVDNLLTLTRADAGPVSILLKETDAVHLVEQAVEDMRPLAEEKNQNLTLAVDGPALILADEATLRLALVNVLDNAIKYTPPSGAISVRSGMRGDDFFIEVTDTGPGIPAEHRGRIFDRFYRIERDRSSQAGGTGLGLSIAKWAAAANGGRIELDSRYQGSTFRIVLPKLAEEREK